MTRKNPLMPPSQAFTGLVGAIVASHLAEPITRPIDGGDLPSRDEVIDTVRLLRHHRAPHRP